MIPELTLPPSIIPTDYDKTVYGENGRSIYQYIPSKPNKAIEKHLYRPHSKQLKMRRISILNTNDEKNTAVNIPIVITKKMLINFHPRVMNRILDNNKKEVKFIFDY